MSDPRPRIGPIGELHRFVRASFVDRVPRDHRISDRAFRRRRIVVVATAVIGAVLLGFSLNVRPGDPLFYLLTGLLAAVWIGGALLSGPIHLGRANTRRGRDDGLPLLQPLVIGVALLAVFCLGALLIAQIPPLRASVAAVLDHARFGSLPLVALITVVNGVAEELFFRGALFAAVGIRYPVLISTAAYTVATVATGNVMLVFAALLLGFVVGLQRRVTGGVLGPIVTHVVWSTSLLFALPPLLDLPT